MKIDDFLVRLKTAMHEVLAVQSSTSVGGVPQSSPDLLPANSVAGREESGAELLVPTVLGVPRSVSVSGDATSGPAIVAKLGSGS